MANKIRFDPGRCVGTPAAIDLLAQQYILPADLLDRHVSGDWGAVSDDDRQANEIALAEGARLVSAYLLNGDADLKILIVTDAADDDGVRAHTTMMLPSEY